MSILAPVELEEPLFLRFRLRFAVAYNLGIMAPKKPSESAPRSNKIRFVLVEADISDGNLSELTQAITSALRPTTQRTLIPKVQPPQLPANGSDVPVEDLELEGEGIEEVPTEQNGDEPAPKPAKPRAKLPLPQYLPDLDLTASGTPFKQFAEEKAPKSHAKRYLVAAAWSKEFGGAETINTDKIYTMYKTAGWPLGISDWDANFRSLVNRNLMQRKSSGEYALTPLGEAELQGE